MCVCKVVAIFDFDIAIQFLKQTFMMPRFSHTLK